MQKSDYQSDRLSKPWRACAPLFAQNKNKIRSHKNRRFAACATLFLAKNIQKIWHPTWHLKQSKQSSNGLKVQESLIMLHYLKYSVYTCIFQKKNHLFSQVVSGGEGEIRTLEPFYRLHDFQSCALDQLGDFSIRYFVFALSLECLYILSQVFRNVNTFFEIFSNFLEYFWERKIAIIFFKPLDKSPIYAIMKTGMIHNIEGINRQQFKNNKIYL